MVRVLLMTNVKSKIEELDRAISDLSIFKTKLLAEQAEIEAAELKTRMDRYKTLECHFKRPVVEKAEAKRQRKALKRQRDADRQR